MSNNGPNVHLVRGEQWGETVMFQRQGWNVVKDPTAADFLCWTGGADIDPSFYGQTYHRTTHTNGARDAYEKHIYELFPEKNKLGICRGGQLLNAFSGGSMFQNVDRHGRTHMAIDTETGDLVEVSSVHHQMMIPGIDGKVLMIAHESTIRETDRTTQSGSFDDIEALWYPATKSFCFQPHPEWGPESCTDYFFEKIGQLYEV